MIAGREFTMVIVCRKQVLNVGIKYFWCIKVIFSREIGIECFLYNFLIYKKTFISFYYELVYSLL